MNLCRAPTTPLRQKDFFRLYYDNARRPYFVWRPHKRTNVWPRATPSAHHRHSIGIIFWCWIVSIDGVNRHWRLHFAYKSNFEAAVSFFACPFPGRPKQNTPILTVVRRAMIRARRWHRHGNVCLLELADFGRCPDVWQSLILSQQWPNNRLAADTMTGAAVQPFRIKWGSVAHVRPLDWVGSAPLWVLSCDPNRIILLEMGKGNRFFLLFGYAASFDMERKLYWCITILPFR